MPYININKLNCTREEFIELLVNCYIKIYKKLLIEYDEYILNKKKYLEKEIYSIIKNKELTKYLIIDFIKKEENIIKVSESNYINYNY
jgi:hypothetical protein